MNKTTQELKIVLVHDYLNEAGGAERVLRVLSEMYPEAPIYTAFVKKGSARELFRDRVIRQSKWGWFLGIGRFYSYFRFLLPWIWRSVDLSGYDLVITSTAGGYIARGFRVDDSAKVIAYCHTPPKWLYGYETPTDARRKWWGRLYLIIFGPYLRYFDYQSAKRVDVWIANSQEVAKRIEKFYRKEAQVVYPPVELRTHEHTNKPTNEHTNKPTNEHTNKPTNEHTNKPTNEHTNKPTNEHTNKPTDEEYYLTVARVTGAKGLVEAARAARTVKRRLIVVGELVMGHGLGRVIKEAGGKWVELVGRVGDQQLVSLYSRARGYLALAPDEDFGMTVVEAMLTGTPVIALRSGGYKETVTRQMGILVKRVEEVPEAMKALENTSWDKALIIKWARQFGRERFEKEIGRIVNNEQRRMNNE